MHIPAYFLCLIPFFFIVMDGACCLCDDLCGQLTRITSKGLKSLVLSAEKRNDGNVIDKLEALKKNEQPVFVHADCRKSFTDKRKFKTKPKAKETHTKAEGFNLNDTCLFCAESCDNDSRNTKRKVWVPVRSLELKDSLSAICKSRKEADPDDHWSEKVESRIQSCIDLVAAKARYHPGI